MNTYYLVCSILALLFIAYFSFEKYRAYKGDRRFRHSCTNPLCDNDDCEMIYLRMKKPIDPLESRFVRFLSRSDMLCQTQKKCDKEGCVRKDELQLVGTKIKCFGFLKLIFHPSSCKENALPGQFIGPVRSELVEGTPSKEKSAFLKPALPATVVKFAEPPLYKKWRTKVPE